MSDLFCKKPNAEPLPLVRAATALGADHVRARARVFGVVGIHVDAELLERLLRERRTGLTEPDDVAVVQALHLDAVHVDVEETKVGRGAARGQRTS